MKFLEEARSVVDGKKGWEREVDKVDVGLDDDVGLDGNGDGDADAMERSIDGVRGWNCILVY